MKLLLDKLKENPVVYIARDIERALGLDPDTEGYFIISNNTPFANLVSKNKKNVLLIESEKILDTHELLEHKLTTTFLKKNKISSVVVFKNTKKIESICSENYWKVLNPPAELSNSIEEKLSQLKILEDLSDLFLDYAILKCKNISWLGKKIVVQFNHSHTGSGTILIDSEEKLNTIKENFPEREARVAHFIEGPMFTSNNIVSDWGLFTGNISYQMTGMKPFTDRPFATIGNDWGVAEKMLTKTQKEYYKMIADSVGEKLKTLGWKGMFGIDVILDQEKDKLYLIEINARQTASSTFESKLQKKEGVNGTSVFDAHLASLLNLNLSMSEITKINSGSQIIQRILRDEKLKCSPSDILIDLRKENFNVIKYENINIESELFKVQSDESIMEEHKKLSEVGEKISRIILSSKKMLSKKAMDVIHNYLHLPISDKKVSCPYFNNRRIEARGGLRVFSGKGSVADIVEEVSIIEKKQKVNLKKLDKEGIKKFLVKNNIGIDCSGFVYHVLDTESQARHKGALVKNISFPFVKSLSRKILVKFRPVQNCGVVNFAHEKNSTLIKLKDAKPGDMIIILKSGNKKDRDHILIIDQVNYKTGECHTGKKDIEKKIESLHYAHSFAWSTDGKYGHGVKRGKIEILDIDKDILEQKWIENNETGEGNETFKHAKQAMSFYIKRLNAFFD
jgi:hypothetical protein